MKHTSFKILGLAVVVITLATHVATAADLSGTVQMARKPLAGATVILYSASAGAPTKLAEGKSDNNGAFQLSGGGAPADSVLYVIATGENDAAKLLSVLGTTPPQKITVNEMTTVASAFTSARFIHGESISGNPLGLRIAAGNAPNLVDPQSGTWGKVLLDPINSTQTATLSTLNTLASLIVACATEANDDWRGRFFNAAKSTSGATPKNTLEAIAGIAREPWAHPKELFALFNEAYPQPKDGSRRAAPFVPYLALTPPDFALTLCFAGGGMCANGRFMFDADGNLWSGQNWMPGSQSGVNTSIGGGVLKMSPNGTPLSPPITGFTGMGLDGVGWGTAVTRDKVWAASFNGKILVMDFNGHPVGDESMFPFKEKLFGLMGIGVAANGDVWVADGSNDQLLHFPGGRIQDGHIVKVQGLKSPFDVAIDKKNRVFVSNSQSDTVLEFPAEDPSKVKTYRCGIIVRALALDDKGNLWVASNTSPDFPMPRVPNGASIMEQFKIMGAAALTYNKPTGIISMIRTDGTQSTPAAFNGNGVVNVPWGLNVDGNGDIWIGNFKGRSVVMMAGDHTTGHPADIKTGDVIHNFTGGSIQMLTDVSIDAAGNVWAANNWNNPMAATKENPPFRISSWGGGSGLTVIYGVAAPVKPPRIGEVQTFESPGEIVPSAAGAERNSQQRLQK